MEVDSLGPNDAESWELDNFEFLEIPILRMTSESDAIRSLGILIVSNDMIGKTDRAEGVIWSVAVTEGATPWRLCFIGASLDER